MRREFLPTAHADTYHRTGVRYTAQPLTFKVRRWTGFLPRHNRLTASNVRLSRFPHQQWKIGIFFSFSAQGYRSSTLLHLVKLGLWSRTKSVTFFFLHQIRSQTRSKRAVFSQSSSLTSEMRRPSSGTCGSYSPWPAPSQNIHIRGPAGESVLFLLQIILFCTRLSSVFFVFREVLYAFRTAVPVRKCQIGDIIQGSPFFRISFHFLLEIL